MRRLAPLKLESMGLTIADTEHSVCAVDPRQRVSSQNIWAHFCGPFAFSD